ncbi:MAG: hypothetical protein U9N14_04850, partial [Pseudomonadota bacterium]|nr:hypothetical protein [Pseudomonadota bacterium]
LQGLDDMRDQVSAQQFVTVQKALDTYIYDNFSVLPGVIDFAALRSGYLPGSYTGANPYDQNYTISYRWKVAPPPISDSVLEVAFYTSGGNEIPEVRAAAISARIGATGGYTKEDATGREIARGAYGGWFVALENEWGIRPGPGRLISISAYDQGEVIADYMYRNIELNHPEANQMQTALDMNKYSVVNINNLSAAEIYATSGSFKNITAGDATIENLTAERMEVPSSIKIEGEDLTKGQLETVHELLQMNCSEDEFLTRTIRGGVAKFECIKRNIKDGTVAAFKGATCPPGWSKFDAADDRMIIGSNPENSGNRLAAYEKGEPGGSADYLLALENLPRNTWIGEWKTSPRRFPAGGYPMQTAKNWRDRNNMGQQPLQITPPYVDLTYCIKGDPWMAPPPPCPDGSLDLSYAGAKDPVNVDIPKVCKTFTIVLSGGGGGRASSDGGGPGGKGSSGSTVTAIVNNIGPISVFLGGSGGNGGGVGVGGSRGGAAGLSWNGNPALAAGEGGSTAKYSGSGGGGGGASVLLVNGSAVVIAAGGGGGGGGSHRCGGLSGGGGAAIYPYTIASVQCIRRGGCPASIYDDGILVDVADGADRMRDGRIGPLNDDGGGGGGGGGGYAPGFGGMYGIDNCYHTPGGSGGESWARQDIAPFHEISPGQAGARGDHGHALLVWGPDSEQAAH